MLSALRDEDYAKAGHLIAAGYPTISSFDFRLSVAPFGDALVACGLRDFHRLDRYTAFVNSGGNSSRFALPEFTIPAFLPCLIVVLTDEGRYDHATELMGALYGFSLPSFTVAYPTGWAKRWGLMTRLRAQLEAALGTAGFQAAYERGSHLEPDALIQELTTQFWAQPHD
jgi:hypothetical protein